MKSTKIILASLAITLLGTLSTVHAAGQSDLAKAAQNPIADLISLPLQNNPFNT